MSAPIPFKVYIASALQHIEEAKAYRKKLRALGIKVTSSWLDTADATIAAEAKLSDDERVDLGSMCLDDVGRSDVVLWLYGAKSERCGAVAEAAFAIGRGKTVLATALKSRDDFPTLVLEGSVIHVVEPVHMLAWMANPNRLKKTVGK